MAFNEWPKAQEIIFSGWIQVLEPYERTPWEVGAPVASNSFRVFLLSCVLFRTILETSVTIIMAENRILGIQSQRITESVLARSTILLYSQTHVL